jgi:hypothetical protein
MQTILSDLAKVRLPLPADVAVLFDIVSEDGVPVTPEAIASVTMYRLERGESIDSSSLQTVFSLTPPPGSRFLWSSSLQGVASGEVGEDGVIEIVVGPDLLDGEDHHFGQDHLYVDGRQVSFEQDRFVVTPHAEGFLVSLDVSDDFQVGLEASLAYSKDVVPVSPHMVAPGSFLVHTDTISERYWPGTHYCVMEFDLDGERRATTIKFDLLSEQSHARPPEPKRDELRETLLKKRLPHAFFDSDPDGEFERLASFLDEAMARNDDAIDALGGIWSVETSPSSLLRYIAAEMGTSLIGVDPSSWRAQLQDLALRWKRRGSIKMIRERLSDCGIDLERFTRFLQVSTDRFRSFATVVTRDTPRTQLDEELGGDVLWLKMPEAPWIFPSLDVDRPEFVPMFAVLEIRSEGSSAWRNVPSSVGGQAILRFRRVDDGWAALLSPYSVKDDGQGLRSLSVIDDQAVLGEFSEVRITYPVKPWGVKMTERRMAVSGPNPRTRRSGYCVVRASSSDPAIFVGGHDGVPSCATYDVATLAELTSPESPSPRTGFALFHYGESKAMLAGGVSGEDSVLGDCWIFDFSDPEDVTWTKYVGATPPARCGATHLETSDASGNRRHLLFGGWSDSGALRDTWEWDPDAETWSEHRQPSVLKSVGNFVVSGGPVGESFTASCLPDESLVSLSETVVLRDASSPSRGYLSCSVDAIGSGNITATILSAEGDFSDDEAISTVPVWRLSWAAEAFEPTRIGPFETAVGPAGESLSGVNAETDPTYLSPGDVRRIAPTSSPRRGELTIEITGTTVGTISFDVLGATGEFVQPENVASVHEWMIVDYHDVAVHPSETGLRPGHEVLLSDMEGGGASVSAVVTETGAGTFSLRIISVAEGATYPASGFLSVDIVTGSPSARVGASSSSFRPSSSSQLRHAVMFGGTLGTGEPSGEVWTFDHAAGWLRLEVTGLGPVGHSASVVRVPGTSGDPDEIFVGAASGDEVTGGDDGLFVSRPSLWHRLSGVDEDDPGDVNRLGSAAWVAVTCDAASAASTEVSPGFDDNGTGDEFFLSTSVDPGLLLSRSRTSKVFSGSLSVAEGAELLPETAFEANTPASTTRCLDASSFEREPYETHVDEDVASVSAPAMYDEASLPVQAPSRASNGDGGPYWSISPETVVRQHSSVLTPMPGPSGAIEMPQAMSLSLPSAEPFVPTTELISFCPVAEPGRSYVLLARLLDRDRRVVGHVAVDDDGDVAHQPVERLVSGSEGLIRSDRDAFLISYAGRMLSVTTEDPATVPMIVDYYVATRSEDLPPMVGSYARVDDEWYRLVAAPDGRMPKLSLVDVDGTSYELSATDFAFVYSPSSGRTSVWLSADDEPDLSGVESLELDGYFPLSAVVLPPCRSRRSVSFTVSEVTSFKGVLCWSRYWPESAHGEPDALWGEPSWEESSRSLAYQAEDLGEEDRWRVTVLRDGRRLQVPMTEVSLVKRLRREEHDTVVELTFRDPDGFLSPGDVVVLNYPLRSFARLSHGVDLDAAGVTGDARALLGSDRRGASSISRIASVEFSEEATRVSIRSGAAMASGRSDRTVSSHLVSSANVDVSSEALPDRPYGHADAYHAPLDDGWAVDGRPIWSSERLLGLVASSGLPAATAAYDSVEDVPLFAAVRSVSLALGDARSLSLALTTASVPGDVSPSDLLVAAVTQGRSPQFTDARFIGSDWLALFTLSLPRMDRRVLDKMVTYEMWRASIVAGEAPSVVPSPAVNHETRLIEKDHPLAATLCPGDTTPSPPIVFGLVRTEAPYGKTVYNTEEYDGSTKPSHDPCDADPLFVDPCSCSPASNVSYAVRIPVDSNVTVMDVESLMAEALPAHAVPTEPEFRFHQEEPIASTYEEISSNLGKDVDETCLCYDPRAGEDGKPMAHTPWNQFIETEPHADVEVTATGAASEDDLWLLLAEGMFSSRIPFGSIDDTLPSVGVESSVAFVITNDGSARLLGVRRYGESSLLFRQDVGGTPDARSRYSIWNRSMSETTSTSSVSRDTTWISFDAGVLTSVDVKQGDVAIFRFSPADPSELTGEMVQYSATVLRVISTEGEVWLELDVADATSSMPLLSSPGDRTCAMLVSRGGSVTSSACARIHQGQVIDEDYLRGVLTESKSLPMSDYGSLRSELVFELRRTVLRSCLVLCDRDLAEHPVLSDAGAHSYDPDAVGALVAGDVVDAIGFIVGPGGDRLCDFVIAGGRLKAKVSEGVGTSISSHSVSADSITVEFAHQFEKLSLSSFVAVFGSGNSDGDGRVRPTAMLLPRSRDARLDVGLDRALFIAGAPHPDWVAQSGYTLRRVTVVSYALPGVGSTDLRVGDSVFSSASGYLVPREVIEVNRGSGVVKVALYDSPPASVGSETILGARLAYESETEGSWLAARRSVVIDVDVLALMPSGHEDYDYARTYSSLVIGDRAHDLLEVEAGPSPGTTLLRLTSPVSASILPAPARFLARDIDESYLTKAEFIGGSYVKCDTYVDGTLVDSQDFN